MVTDFSVKVGTTNINGIGTSENLNESHEILSETTIGFTNIVSYTIIDGSNDKITATADYWNAENQKEIKIDAFNVDLNIYDFVDADINMEESYSDLQIFLTNSKRAQIDTGSGDDLISVVIQSNGPGWGNTFDISSESGDDKIYLSNNYGTQYTSYRIYTGDGADYINASEVTMNDLSEDYPDQRMIDTGDGEDQIIGSQGNDYIDGGNGADTIYTGEGNDEVYGGFGQDVIYAEGGSNIIYGERGADIIFGGEGENFLYGGRGADTIYGGEGINLLSGGLGADTIYGGSGNNEIYGGAGRDTIYAGAGENYIEAGRGADTVYGGEGDDIIYGGSGADTIYANNGENQIYGGLGADTIYAGEGDDFISGGFGQDTIYAGNGNNEVYAGNGSDLIYTGSGSDIIDGGNGADTIYAGAGNDTVIFDSQDSLVDAGDGFDALIIDDSAVSIDSSVFSNFEAVITQKDQVNTINSNLQDGLIFSLGGDVGDNIIFNSETEFVMDNSATLSETELDGLVNLGIDSASLSAYLDTISGFTVWSDIDLTA